MWSAVVFFGEVLDPQVLRVAFEEAENCDFLFAVASSLAIHPAADTPQIAKKRGATLGIINKQKTPLDTIADYVINGETEKILPQIIQAN